ncbi:MAG: hypothetical protein U1F43_13375 [Myxococcota bacterium]
MRWLAGALAEGGGARIGPAGGDVDALALDARAATATFAALRDTLRRLRARDGTWDLSARAETQGLLIEATLAADQAVPARVDDSGAALLAAERLAWLGVALTIERGAGGRVRVQARIPSRASDA